MSDKTIKKINYWVGGIGFVLIAGFIISEEILAALLDSQNTWLPIIDALFQALFGLTALILGFVNSIAAWTRTSEEYVQLLSLMIFPSWAKRALVIRSDRYWLWQARLTQPFTFLMGAVFFFGSLSVL